MSKPASSLREADLVVRSLALGLSPGQRIDGHAHEWGQLIYAKSGTLAVTSGRGQWMVPPRRAVWMPAGVDHSLESVGRTALRTLYLHPSRTERLDRQGAVLGMGRFAIELVLHIIGIGMLSRTEPAQDRLAHVLVDLLEQAEQEPLSLSWPRDQRALRVARRVQEDLTSNRSLAELAAGSGASRRTLERIFLDETGLAFGRWRQQARLLEAVRLLGEGATVTSTGMAVGYESTSAFISMVRRQLGTTPGRLFESSGPPLP